MRLGEEEREGEDKKNTGERRGDKFIERKKTKLCV